MLKLLSLMVPLASAAVIHRRDANISAIASEWNSTSNSSSSLSLNRPAVHYSPEEGWMNDPNGLWYDAKEEDWHIYYQYYPDAPHWGLPLTWGHAVSKDLTVWDEQGVAFGPEFETAGAFSGSMVIDYNNTSGFFNSSTDPRQRVVAIWTLDYSGSETQQLSYSHDGGYTFTEYSDNPVLDIDSDAFRDPKVFWYQGEDSESEGNWVMTVAEADRFSVLIYSSPDLKNWTLESNFSREGYLGYNYECPGLVKVPYVKNTTYASAPGSNITSSGPLHPNSTVSFSNSSSIAWNASSVPLNITLSNSTLVDETSQLEEVGYAWVMIVSFNPGSILGGSGTEYFIGDFNGTHFEPLDKQTRFLDLGKDYYALQTFFNIPNEVDVLGIAWASNWQYANQVPTDPWRSSMSLVRNFTITEYNINSNTTALVLNSQPVLDFTSLRKNGTSYTLENLTLNSSSHEVLEFEDPTGVFEFSLEYSVNFTGIHNWVFTDLSLYFQGDKDSDEYLRLGYEANSKQFFLDRGHSNIPFVQENPFFTQRLSVSNPPSSNSSTFDVYGIVDRNIIELYFNNGTVTSTNTFFFSTGNNIGSIIVKSGVDDVYEIESLKVNQFYVD